jgi:hypothetical protein
MGVAVGYALMAWGLAIYFYHCEWRGQKYDLAQGLISYLYYINCLEVMVGWYVPPLHSTLSRKKR